MYKKRRLLISLEEHQVEYLDTRKQQTGVSRAAAIRSLVEREIKRGTTRNVQSDHKLCLGENNE